MENIQNSTHAESFVHFFEIGYESEDFRIPNKDNYLFSDVMQTFISMLSL